MGNKYLGTCRRSWICCKCMLQVWIRIPVSTEVFKNLLPCCGEYSCHRQGYTWQTKQHFQTCPSTISGGQPLGISKRMKITLPWQSCLTAVSAFHQEAGGTWQCADLFMHEPPRAESWAPGPGSSPRRPGGCEQSRRSSSFAAEFSDLLDKSFHLASLPGMQRTLPTAILATETAGKGKTPTQQAPFVSMEKCRACLGLVPSSSKGHQLKSGIIVTASGFQLFYFITLLSLFNAQGSGIKRIILNGVLLKQGEKSLWQWEFKVESSRLQRLGEEENSLNLLNSPNFCSWLAKCYSGCGITMCFLQISALS